MLDDDTVLATAARFASLDTAAMQLVNLANEAGGTDNITAALARIEAA
jgi:serine/threonine protein phosphatase PrpC